jgi:hypothetical protein
MYCLNVRIVQWHRIHRPHRDLDSVTVRISSWKNYGATNVAPPQKDRPLPSSKRKPHFSNTYMSREKNLLKLQRLQNKVLRTIRNFPRCTPVRDLRTAFNLPYVYDYITKFCRQQTKVIHNHGNNYVPSIVQGEARYEKYKRVESDIDFIRSWWAANYMKFNISKTKVISSLRKLTY